MQKLKRNIKTYYLYTFFTSCVLFGAITIPFYKDWGGINQTQIQTLQSIFMIAVFLFEIPTGVIADFFGRKASLILGAFFWIIGVLVYASCPNFWNFALGEIIVALGNAFISGANQSILYDSLKSLKIETKAKQIIANGEILKMTGLLIGSVLGAFLTNYLELNIIFAFTALTQIAALASALFFIEPEISHYRSETKKWLDVLKSGVGDILLSKKLRLLSFDIIFTSSLVYYVIWFYQALLREENIPISYFGLFGAVLVISESIVLKFQKQIEKFFKGERNYLIVSSLIASAGFMIGAIFQHWAFIILFLVLAGGFGLTRSPIYIAILNRFIKSGNRATSISTINLFRSLFIAIINPFFGMLADWNLNYTLLYISFFLFLGSIISIKITRQLDF